ncbi:MAG: hypothetical protein KAS86_04330, partial [Candidatus Omnitrophica bacterium]|nr:hypothetical protein [Candidatus Omnitrophota bacterium]
MDRFISRTIISLLLLAFVTVVIYVFPLWLFCVVVALFVGFAQAEFFRMVEGRKIFVYKYFGTVVGSLVPLVIFAGYSLPGMKNLEPLLIIAAGLF